MSAVATHDLSITLWGTLIKPLDEMTSYSASTTAIYQETSVGKVPLY